MGGVGGVGKCSLGGSWAQTTRTYVNVRALNRCIEDDAGLQVTLREILDEFPVYREDEETLLLPLSS